MVRLTPTRMLCAVVFLFTFICFFYVSSSLYGERGYDLMIPRPPPDRTRPDTPRVPFGEECAPFSSGVMDDVTVVLKMGTADVRSKLRGWLNRLGRCKTDILLFSDRNEDVNSFRIVDALAHLRPEYRYKNPDFDVYDEIQRTNGTTDKLAEGWRLDRYMFLPMMELTAHFRPETNWFIFVEIDTYVNWDNMYRFLDNFNPLTPYYFGSPVWPKKKAPFAHSGSGYVLSRGAMNKLVARGRMFAENHRFPGTHLFGKDLTKECCGDEVLAKVLKECGIKLNGYWPMFNAEKPSSIMFGREQWCEAIVTLHHMHDSDYDDLRHWESARKDASIPLTFEELFSYIEPTITDQKEDWSNLSGDVVHKAPHSAAKTVEACRAACGADKKCLQFEHLGDTCRLSHVVRMGHDQYPEENRRWVSGWMMERIGTFRETRSPCLGAHFVHPNP
ncbi:hypothetical protein B0J11DRAFT_71569 [Dendryphion nanum]|uniref:N-acetylgalactosaminide beta-1,3-galactosyltransferase n=1 Tax=Dendryphion nanum TaxID=256645 RepID=A0A9P9DIK7_9PLEO|nr:hypothetical protein B0J11DRAFT_71569 [Dendryphion nanum]